jgi:penicillin-binding protein
MPSIKNKLTSTKSIIMIYLKVLLGVIKWTFLIGIVGAIAASSLAVGYVAAIIQDEEIRSRELILKEMQLNSETGFVYFRDGTLLGELRAEEERRLIVYSDIPEMVENAVLATEDSSFYEHIGVDLTSLARAVRQRVLNEELQTGGSTITQQLARRVFLSLEKTDSRKIKEIFLALRLERYMTKEEILAAYLNKIPFGNGSTGYNLYGIKSAARGIFDKDLNSLTIAQIAYLAGLPQQPSRFSAFNSNGTFDAARFALAKSRQEHVLSRMLAVGKISNEQYEEALAFDLRASLAERKLKAYNTFPYLMIEAEREAAEILVRLRNPELKLEQIRSAEYAGTLEDAKQVLLRNGYKVYLSIDKDIYNAMHRISDNPEMFSADDEETGVEQVGGILIDNRTGAILGMIEGRDFNLEQLNHATQMLRQPGSAMKPLAAFLPALETGLIQPAAVIDDVPLILPDGSKKIHIPRNWDGKFHGIMTAREALNKSWNIPAIKLFTEGVTIPIAWEFVKNLGISSITDSDYYAQTGVIGGLEYGVSLKEFTNAYATIANQGKYQEAFYIQKITDLNGKIIYEHEAIPRTVFSEETAYLMTDMLRTVISDGTGSDVRRKFEFGDKIPLAGKTGTTSEDYDVWFIGYSPDVTLGIWIGYGQPAKLTEPKRAKFIWAEVMNELVRTKPELFMTETFPEVSNIVTKTVSAASGLLPSESVIQENLIVTDIFNRAYIPTKIDDIFEVANVIMTDGKPYIPQSNTPSDMFQKMRVVKRAEPLYSLLKRIEEANATLPSEDQKPIESFRPTDGYGDAPIDVDPRVDDGRNPSAPTKLNLVKTATGIKVMFAPSSHKDLAGYRIYRSVDGGPFLKMNGKTVFSGSEPFFLDEISDNKIYGYQIVAVDIVGKTSEPSQAIYNGELPPKTITIPTPPLSLEITTDELGAKLTWELNPQEQEVIQYHVYYSAAQEGAFALLGSTKSNEFVNISLSPKGWYSIAAENSTGKSTPSAPISFEP